VCFQIRQNEPYWKEGHIVKSAGLLTAVSCQQPVWRYVRGVNKQIIVVGNKFDLSRPFAFSPPPKPDGLIPPPLSGANCMKPNLKVVK
jgi:hypothetical protein